MGQFSWLDCVTGEQIIDNKFKDVYVLIPKEFGGGHIVEHCYDGYGHFGGYDIYDLVANWNRGYLTMDFELPYSKAKLKNKYWAETYFNVDNNTEDIEKIIHDSTDNKYFEYSFIGIELACYDKDNEALPFPIKITYDENAEYENCPPSKEDPNQGWEYEEDDWF